MDHIELFGHLTPETLVAVISDLEDAMYLTISVNEAARDARRQLAACVGDEEAALMLAGDNQRDEDERNYNGIVADGLSRVMR